MAAALETELFTLQEDVEHLWEQVSTRLTDQQTNVLSLDLDSVLTSVLASRYPATFGYWQIPGTKSTLRHTQLTEMIQEGNGYLPYDSGKVTQLVHSWRPGRHLAPLLSVVITDSRLNRGGLTTMQVIVRKQGFPSRSFSYSPVEQT